MLLNITRLKKNIVLIKPACTNISDTKDLIEEIKDFISNEGCNNIILDLSGLNFLNCIRIGVLSATYHFVKFISGKIYLIVNDKQAQKSIETLNLSNAVVVYNTNQLALENIA